MPDLKNDNGPTLICLIHEPAIHRNLILVLERRSCEGKYQNGGETCKLFRNLWGRRQRDTIIFSSCLPTLNVISTNSHMWTHAYKQKSPRQDLSRLKSRSTVFSSRHEPRRLITNLITSSSRNAESNGFLGRRNVSADRSRMMTKATYI